MKSSTAGNINLVFPYKERSTMIQKLYLQFSTTGKTNISVLDKSVTDVHTWNHLVN